MVTKQIVQNWPQNQTGGPGPTLEGPLAHGLNVSSAQHAALNTYLLVTNHSGPKESSVFCPVFSKQKVTTPKGCAIVLTRDADTSLESEGDRQQKLLGGRKGN